MHGFLVLWTEEQPFTVLSALASKQWITAGELRSMIDEVRADEIVIAIDACHAGAALPHVLRVHRRKDDWQGREAVIMSSTEEQYSYFTDSGANGLFTKKLSEAIASGSSTMKVAFERAASETIAYLATDVHQEKCSQMLRRILHKTMKCEQTPILYDPSDLLPTIELDPKDPVQ